MFRFSQENWKTDLWRRLRRRHMDISDTVRAAADSTFLQVAVAVAAVTIESICEFYNVFNFAARNASTVVNPVWPLLAVLEICITLSSCHEAQRESDKLLEIIHDTLNSPGLSERAYKELQVLRLQVAHLAVRCEAMSCVPLDRRTIQAMISVSTTQLVILLQIQLQ
ncbi:uncharacterized protein LOC127749966 [Frankliniella occidentalis]|uniref:Uncharacterized protein LOC127749966 n=1 Tax=Frankliniella occidentalis TaxID=133901 RepID=A0A9C6WS36_FRAOC|nr:uncharacterized protein LOC127749966 [Frankliniella occidentalis]